MEELIKKFFECCEDDLENMMYEVKQDYLRHDLYLFEEEEKLKKLENLKEDWEYRQQNRWKSLEKDKENCKSWIEHHKKNREKSKYKLSLYEDLKKELLK